MQKLTTNTGNFLSFIVDTRSMELIISKRNLLFLYDDINFKLLNNGDAGITDQQIPIIGRVDIPFRKKEGGCVNISFTG